MSKQWGDWKNLGTVGQGGLGRVFKVEHVSSGKIGALKQLINTNRIARLKNEVDAVKQLEHPHVASLIDADVGHVTPYAVFEWVDGGSIGDLSDEELRAIPLDQRLNWCQQVCAALQVAHEKGLIHRDIKPDNVLLDKSRQTAKLCDFGLVFFSDGERVTATMEQAGSRYYIAPECEDGRPETIVPATDLYSLGKLIYYVASGGRMFARERHREVDRELSVLLDNPFAEHLSNLLDSLVVGDVNARAQNAAEAIRMIDHTRRRLSMPAPCRGKPETHKCIFCGEGNYEVVAFSQDGTAAHNSGYPDEGNIGNQHFIFVECNVCGNSQRFKFNRGGDWFAVEDPKRPGERRVRSKNLSLHPDGSR